VTSNTDALPQIALSSALQVVLNCIENKYQRYMINFVLTLLDIWAYAIKNAF